MVVFRVIFGRLNVVVVFLDGVHLSFTLFVLVFNVKVLITSGFATGVYWRISVSLAISANVISPSPYPFSSKDLKLPNQR